MTSHVNIDYFLDEETLDILQISDIYYKNISDQLNEKFLGKEDEIDYIYYTGINCNTNYKHNLDEFIEIVEKLNFEGTWPYLIASTGAGIVWKSHIDNLINKIFRYFESEESNIEGQYIYYTLQEYDANNSTYFEEISNAFLIGIKTKINNNKIGSLLLSLLKMIIDRNFWQFNDIDEVIYIAEENRENKYTDNEKEKIINYDLMLWIDILMNIDVDLSKSTSIPFERYDYLLHNRETGKLTHPELGDFSKKYFSLNELNVNLKI
jgi:predicted MPP superfamily phosphohydrolase